jgi:hypothetical protein
MVERMHDVVLNATPRATVEVQFFSISCDETISINNQAWAKCMFTLCKIGILKKKKFFLKKVLKGTTSNSMA